MEEKRRQRNVVNEGSAEATAKPPVPLALVIAVAIVGVSMAAILVRWSGASAYALAFWRLTLSLAIIAGAIIASRDGAQLLQARRTDLALLAIAGVLLAFHFVIRDLGLRRLGLSVRLPEPRVADLCRAGRRAYAFGPHGV